MPADAKAAEGTESAENASPCKGRIWSSENCPYSDKRQLENKYCTLLKRALCEPCLSQRSLRVLTHRYIEGCVRRKEGSSGSGLQSLQGLECCLRVHTKRGCFISTMP